MAGWAAERDPADVHMRSEQTRVDGRAGILRFELTHLPLAGEQPERVANFRAQTAGEILRARAWLEPVVSGDLRVAINVREQRRAFREDVVQRVDWHINQGLRTRTSVPRTR